jgi:predicted PurR-regulated permease PerM
MARDAVRAGSHRALNILAGVAVVFFIATAMYWARVIFIPVALAIYFAFILTPPVIFLQRHRIPRVISVMLVVLGAMIAFAATGLVVGRQIVNLTRTLPDHEDKIRAKVESVKAWVNENEGNRFASLINEVYDTFSEDSKRSNATQGVAPPAVVVETQPTWVSRTQGVLTPAAAALGQAAFTFILLVFMLNRREDLRNRLIRLLGQGRLTTTTKAVDETSRRISRFLLVQFLLNATFGVIITIGLLLMKVPYAPLWGFLGFLMRYVPYIGSWIAVIPPALFTFAVSETWAPPIMVFVLFIGLELIAGNVAEPLLFGRSLGLSEVAQLVAAAFWAFLWGPVGLILSGPLTVCLLVLGKYVPQWRFLSVILGDEPVLSARVAFYQRLAARDHDEAAEIVEKELSGKPIEKVIDDMLIPVLATARRDAAEGRLSDDDLTFITGAVREIAEEVVDDKPIEAPSADAPVRVVVLPAKDAADQAAAELFRRIFDPRHWEVEVAPATSLASEMAELVESHGPAIVIVATLPPGGLTHVRYLCRRLRQRDAKLKIVVGRWSNLEEEAPGWTQLRGTVADEVTTSVEATKAYLLGWRTVLVADTRPSTAETDRREPSSLVGTASA